MSAVRQLKPNIYSVGVVDWDRRLFDELIPLPDGTSYNAYLIKGEEKTALIDTVDSTMTDVLIENLKQLEVKTIDYVITNTLNRTIRVHYLKYLIFILMPRWFAHQNVNLCLWICF